MLKALVNWFLSEKFISADFLKSKVRPSRLLWLDMEMGGLDPNRQPILEVAMIVTNPSLEELDSYHSIIKHSDQVIQNMEPEARELLTANGLLSKLHTGKEHDWVEKEMLAFIEKYFPKEPARLAGNPVYCDLAFLKIWMPSVAARLNHRLLDVSAFKTYFQLVYGVEAKKVAPHLALEDIRASIGELKIYLQCFDTSKLKRLMRNFKS